MTLGLLLTAVFLAATPCRSQEPGPNYKHLKFLEPLVGNWKVVTTEGDKVVSEGQEASEWVLNKNFMRHAGWGHFDGKPVQYEFYTGWNPKTKEVFQWAAGATDGDYGITQRLGTYDPDQKAWTSQGRLLLSNGEERTDVVRFNLGGKDRITIDFTERRDGGQAQPDEHDTFTRAARVAPPALDDTPGPGYEHLKPIEWLVGDWSVRGTWADGKPHEGEEHTVWAYDKNFIQGTGWWKDREGKRIDYHFMIAWDPKLKKLRMATIDSEGGHDTGTADYDPQLNKLLDQHLGPLYASANPLAVAGKWDQVAAEVAKALDAAPENQETYIALAVAQLMANDVEGYRATCSRAFEQFGNSNPYHRAYLAQLCSLAPESGIDHEKIAEIMAKDMDKVNATTVALAAGMHDLRCGRYEEAIARLPKTGDDFQVPACLLLRAIAHQRLNQGEQARELLDQGTKELQQRVPGPEGPALAVYMPERWVTWGMLQILKREAEVVVHSAGKKD